MEVPAWLMPHLFIMLLCGMMKPLLNLFTNDTALIVFIMVFAGRYLRLLVSVWYFFQYKPAKVPLDPSKRKHTNKDVTILIPTVSCSKNDNADFEECLTTCLINKPAKLVIITDTKTRQQDALEIVRQVREKIENGTSVVEGLGPMSLEGVETEVQYSGIASKRRQLAQAIRKVETKLTLFVDDHVFLPREFILHVVAAFEDDDVGICGTNKEVRRQAWTFSLVGLFMAFINYLGCCYLARHNFEIRATNAMDGGVFVVSGRSQMVRTDILKEDGFLDGYLGERFLFGTIPANGKTPLARLFAKYIFGQDLKETDETPGLDPDDDNFITRWIVRTGRKVKIQYSDETKIETTLGVYPKFFQQCLRWSRTTIRSNPAALFTDRAIWRRWPWTVWTTYIACLFNFAFIWDPAIVYALTRTELYANSEKKGMIIACLCLWIYLTKLVKPFNFLVNHPMDFFLFYFPIPVAPLFSYYHSILKAWSVLTFWDGTWSGRPTLGMDAQKLRKD